MSRKNLKKTAMQPQFRHSNMEDKFDIVLVHNNFTLSLHDDDDIKLREYLQSYEELKKFFALLGTLFGFVANDLSDKLAVLNNLLNDSEKAAFFTTVKTMMDYEERNNLLRRKDYVSGCRTLLRLHRGLQFIHQFLKYIGDVEADANTGPICRRAYDETLAIHHTWLVRNSARVAMVTMPNKQDLFVKVCGDEEARLRECLNCLPEMLSVSLTVYERIDNLYKNRDLHDLP